MAEAGPSSSHEQPLISGIPELKRSIPKLASGAPQTPSKKRKASSSMSPDRARTKRTTSAPKPKNRYHNVGAADPYTAEPMRTEFQVRRIRRTANWSSLIPSLVYPLMAILPSMQDPSQHLKPWTNETVWSCPNGCTVKSAKVRVLSFGGMFLDEFTT